MTNADKIRKMSDGQLAKFLIGKGEHCNKYSIEFCSSVSCYDCCLSWLKQKVNSPKRPKIENLISDIAKIIGDYECAKDIVNEVREEIVNNLGDYDNLYALLDEYGIQHEYALAFQDDVKQYMNYMR